jgi:phage-related protein
MADVEFNGTDPSTFGFTARAIDGVLIGPSHSFERHLLPGRAGAAVGLRSIATRPFTVDFYFESTSLAKASSAVDKLTNLVTRLQPSTVIFAWDTGRRLSAECLGVQVTPRGPAFGLFKYEVRLLFDAADPPFWEGATQHSVTSVTSSGAKTLPQGNAPTRPQIRVTGSTVGSAGSTCVLTLLNSTGGTVASIRFNFAPTSSEFLAVDMDAQTAYSNPSGFFGTGTNRLANLTSGDFFAVLPEYSGLIASSSWAQLQVSTGIKADVFYYKAWE